MLYPNLANKNNSFICRRIDNLDELRKFIKEHEKFKLNNQKLTNTETTFMSKNRLTHFIYRGIKEAKFPLNTSLQFHWETISRFHSSISQLEYLKTMVNRLRANKVIKSYQKAKEKYTDIGYLALMQHYSVPTPFMDWTPNIKVALNFCHDGIDLENMNDEISNYVSLYYIDLYTNWEFYNNSLQQILQQACCMTKKIKDETLGQNVNMDNSSLDNLFKCSDLGIDFLFIEYSAKNNITDIFGNTFNLINPNILMQEGGFVINLNEKLLNELWNSKLSDNNSIILNEHINRIGGLDIKTTTSELPNRKGIIPNEKIHCVNIKKDILNQWYNEGGKLEHYNNSEDSLKLKKAVLETYFTWLMDYNNDKINLFIEKFVRNGVSDDEKIAKTFIEEYRVSH